MVKWTKIESNRNKKKVMWHYDVYETKDKNARNRYKIVWVPTAACKKERGPGDPPKREVKYSNTMPR